MDKLKWLVARDRPAPSGFCLIVALLVSACAAPPATTVASPSVSSTQSASTAPSATATALAQPRPLMPGTLVTMVRPTDMVTIFSTGGQLYGRTTREGGSPYLTKIVRADRARSMWEVVHETDAHVPVHVPKAGRVAFFEYREQGGGANTHDLVVVELATGKATKFDAFALSPATFRGGGGGPRRPVTRVALGERNLAWTRLIERPGGVIEGELRVGSLAEPTKSTAVATSLVTVDPISIDDTVLVYGVATGDRLDIRELTLASGADRLLASTSHWTDVRASGPWLGWQDLRVEGGQPFPTGSFTALDRETGERRTLPFLNCRGVTANADFFAFACNANTDPATVFDWRRWASVPVVNVPPPVLLEAIDGALVWQSAGPGGVGLVSMLVYQRSP